MGNARLEIATRRRTSSTVESAMCHRRMTPTDCAGDNHVRDSENTSRCKATSNVRNLTCASTSRSGSCRPECWLSMSALPMVVFNRQIRKSTLIARRGEGPSACRRAAPHPPRESVRHPSRRWSRLTHNSPRLSRASHKRVRVRRAAPAAASVPACRSFRLSLSASSTGSAASR